MVFKRIKKAASTVGSTVRKGASKAGSSVTRGASRAGRGVRSGASRAGRTVRSGASRAGSSVKRGASRAGEGATSIGGATVSVVKEAANRVAGLPEAGLNAVGVLPRKKLRLRVIVLADGSGQPVLAPGGGRSTVDQVMDSVRTAQQIFAREAKVDIVAAGGTFVTVDTKPAPPAVLTVRCQGGAMKDDLGQAGSYFRSRSARNVVGSVIGAGSPITAFVVVDVVGKAGCSLGPLTDYVTVDVGGIASGKTLAHEIGHALGLPHTGGVGKVVAGESSGNLMQASGAGEHLNKRQVVLVRNSRHVTFA